MKTMHNWHYTTTLDAEGRRELEAEIRAALEKRGIDWGFVEDDMTPFEPVEATA